MNRFRTVVMAGTLIGLFTISAACTSTEGPTSSRGFSSAYQKDRDYTLNPACAGGFRPSNGRSCSY